MEIKITGLDEVQRNLENLQRRAENLNGPVPFSELFPPEFMRRYLTFLELTNLLLLQVTT